MRYDANTVELALEILIVDDDPDHCWLLRDALDFAGVLACVHEVRSAEEARVFLDDPQEYPPDLLFIDIDLPGRDGLALLRDLRAEPFWAGVGVIVLTGRPDAALQRRLARQAGANAFLQKTGDMGRTVRLMRRLLCPVRRKQPRHKVPA